MVWVIANEMPAATNRIANASIARRRQKTG
jgi:hypothetical protein